MYLSSSEEAGRPLYYVPRVLMKWLSAARHVSIMQNFVITPFSRYCLGIDRWIDYDKLLSLQIFLQGRDVVLIDSVREYLETELLFNSK